MWGMNGTGDKLGVPGTQVALDLCGPPAQNLTTLVKPPDKLQTSPDRRTFYTKHLPRAPRRLFRKLSHIGQAQGHPCPRQTARWNRAAEQKGRTPGSCVVSPAWCRVTGSLALTRALDPRIMEHFESGEIPNCPHWFSVILQFSSK